MDIVKQQIEVTEIASHPFVPKFYYTFSDEKHILKATEYV